MNKIALKYFTMLVLIGFCSTALPPQVKVCQRNDPQLALCFKNSMESLRPLLKSGHIAPGFKIEALDPLFVGDLGFNRGYEMRFTQMQAFGLSTFKVEKVRINLDKKIKVEILMTVPKVSVTAKYTLNMKLALLNLQGSGDGYANLENVKVVLRLFGSYYTRNGVTFIKIDDTKVSLKSGSTKVRFDNLFNGQKGLEDVANQAINQNIALIEKDLFPEVEQNVAKIVLKVSNQVFERASASEFFP